MRIASAALGAALAATPLFAPAQGFPLTRVTWSERCPSDPSPPGAPFLAALAAILLPKLVDSAIDHAGAAIKAAADTKSLATQSAPLLDRFYQVTATGDLSPRADLGCLTVVRAVYKTASIADPESLVFRMEARIVHLAGLKYFVLEPYYLETGAYELGSFWDSRRDLSVSVTFKALGAADPFASWTFEWQEIPPQLKLQPGDLRLKSQTSAPLPYPAEASDANGAKARQAAKIAPHVVAMDVLDQASAPPPLEKRPSDLKAANAELIKYCAAVEVGNAKLPRDAKVLDERCMLDVRSTEEALNAALSLAYKSQASVIWARGMCPEYKGGDTKCCPADADGAAAKCVAANQSGLPWAGNVKGKAFGPFLTSVTLTESRRANKFGLALAGAVASSADEIKKTVKERIVPAEKAKVEAALATESRAQREAIRIADLEVSAAEAALSAAQADQGAHPGDATKAAPVIKAQIELVRKKIAANEAYRKAGQDIPHPEYG